MGNVRFYRRIPIIKGLLWLNISKGGISFSFGMQGARVTAGTSGVRTTVGIPGTGLFYTSHKSLNKKEKQQQEKVLENNMHKNDNNIVNKSNDKCSVMGLSSIRVKVVDDGVTYNTVMNDGRTEKLDTNEIESIIPQAKPLWSFWRVLIAIIMIPSTGGFWLLYEAGRYKAPQKSKRFWTYLDIIITLFSAGIWLLYVFGKFMGSKRFPKPIKLTYDLSENIAVSYVRIVDAFEELAKSNVVDEVTGRITADKKTNAGASSRVDTNAVNMYRSGPFDLDSNVLPPVFEFKYFSIYLLPDTILIHDYKNGDYHRFSYTNITMKALNTKMFVDNVPNDANVVGQSWLKVNKDGSPDKRFEGNRQISVCLYEVLELSVGNYFCEFHISKNGTIKPFINSIIEYSQFDHNFTFPSKSSLVVKSKLNKPSTEYNESSLKKIAICFMYMAGIDGNADEKELKLLQSFLEQKIKNIYDTVELFLKSAENEILAFFSSNDQLKEFTKITEELSQELNENQRAEILKTMKSIVFSEDTVAKEELGLFLIFQENFS